MTLLKKNKLIFALILLVFVAGACSSVTQGNYSKLSMGMDYSEVLDILGSPDETTDVLGAKNCVWGKGEKKITVKFVGNKTVFYTAKGL